MTTSGSLPARDHVLIKGATILTMDPQLGDLTGDIEIRNGELTGVGGVIEADGADVIEAGRMIALPGFVDTHWHVWGTLMRGVVGDGPDHGWFATKRQLGPHFEPDDTYRGVRLGATEGLAGGVTTVHDWAHNIMSSEDADAVLRAHRELGTRVHFSYSAPSTTPGLSLEQMRTVMGKVGMSVDEPMDFEDISRIQGDVVPEFEGMLTLGIAARGPSRSTPEVYRVEWSQARELGLQISMHCAGTRAEVEKIRQVEVLSEEGLLGNDMLLAHCLYLSAREHLLLAEHGVSVSVSPLSELRLAMGFPQISEMVEAGVGVSLSLDTTAISANADVFQAMRVAVGLENVRQRSALALTPRRVLELNTIEGARALGLDAVTGSLTPGKRADLILVRTDQLNLAPVVDPAVALVHSAQPANVDTVLVDGRVLKRNGTMSAVDSETVVAEAEEALRGLCARAGFELPAVAAMGSR